MYVTLVFISVSQLGWSTHCVTDSPSCSTSILLSVAVCQSWNSSYRLQTLQNQWSLWLYFDFLQQLSKHDIVLQKRQTLYNVSPPQDIRYTRSQDGNYWFAGMCSRTTWSRPRPDHIGSRPRTPIKSYMTSEASYVVFRRGIHFCNIFKSITTRCHAIAGGTARWVLWKKLRVPGYALS